MFLRGHLMKMSIRNMEDFISGAAFVCFGLLGLWLSRTYTVGTAFHMGSGYFPRILCLLLTGLGVIILIKGCAVAGPRPSNLALRPVVLVLGAICIFSFGIERLGLVVSTFLLIGIASMGARDARLRQTVVLSIGLSVLAVMLFVWGLRLTIPVWPPLVSR
jgi:putative tricarboxylic transport membrane protein